ncbi:DUF6252 family protein [Flavobacterium sp. HXWNR69]|uniref:DUF6252 family protein n=1 Tax=Flavobacterium fragile TaxID=2949085 RepID=A0ABT0TCZ5_9FLAO|nr:DUF6252 family protein [Flavobacterium sp. HXWNR69]MCL9768829.1 DUF6252 family protein [Flavobacterium sp. HXWNR69]
MRKIISLLALLVIFSSCEEDIKTNTPAFQANLDNVFWRANDARVTVNPAGGLIITAYTPYETVTLETNSASVGTYILGTSDDSNFVTYDIDSPVLTNTYDSRVVAGPAYKISNLVNQGTLYTNNSAAQTTGGSGSGLRVATQTLNGRVTSATIVSRGLGYVAGDLITVVGGNNNATFRVVNVQQSNGQITITEASDGKFSGTFNFSVVDQDGEVATFSDGFFYKVPSM